jgi:fructoselysine-6-P-deglycase FrlB-like protein
MTYLEDEIFRQPGSWAAAIARADGAPLPAPGERVAVLGCGSSLNVSRAYAWLREAAQTWAESHPALEFRHGPISVADAGTAVGAIGPVPAALAADAGRTGALVTGGDADQPRSLSRAVILA